jgi:hypothetical protein
MDSLIRTQIERNQESRNKWDLYQSHREKITALLISKSKSKDDKLCILGAGNCNDLNLNVLTKYFREIHLVDIDEQAIYDGILRQELGNSDNIYVHGSIDLTGSLPYLRELKQDKKHATMEVKDFIQKTILPLNLDINEPFGVVASLCTLTQLISTVVDALGDDHTYFSDFILKIRNHHLNQLVNLVEPEGWGFLITDIVSSDSFAKMSTISEENFLEVINQLILNQNFFHGVNPYRINSVLSSNPFVSKTQILHPWRWNFGERIYAVCALEIQKRTSLEITGATI